MIQQEELEALFDCYRVLETQLGKNCEQFQLQKHCMSLLQSVLTL